MVVNDDLTPLMRQYQQLKSQVPDSLLFFRMGDFYELFGEDAVMASRLLGITLTTRDRHKAQPVAMAGVPHHSATSYIQKLLQAGKKVAIGEQMENPEQVKPGKMVRREIVRILTPAVHFDSQESEPSYLATWVTDQKNKAVLVCLEASTGEVLLSPPLSKEQWALQLRSLAIRHYLHWDSQVLVSDLGLGEKVLIENLPSNYLSLHQARSLLKKHYQVEALDIFLPSEASVLALGIVLTYVLRTQQQASLAHLRLPELLCRPQSLQLGPQTASHLDLHQLFDLMNQTHSALGARQLKRWMRSALTQTAAIEARQLAVQEVAERSFGEKLGQIFAQVYDLERICGRLSTQCATPRDTFALGQSFALLPILSKIIKDLQSPLWKKIQQKFEPLLDLLEPFMREILQSQKSDPPMSCRDGGIFHVGVHAELDHLLNLTQKGQDWLMELENREREKTNIPSLKVRYNRVFGYYIEVTQAHLKNVPSHYSRKQTRIGAERFITEELKKFEEEILTASTRQKILEQELFLKLLDRLKEQVASLMNMASVLGEIDALVSLSWLVKKPGWNFPRIDDSFVFAVDQGRHPVMDHLSRGQFVPNSLHLSPETQNMLLITGPNMGGKSTLMRQMALIVILGQMGAPVPAQHAHWGVVSSIYTRIGAQDAITQGQSTFMVEMSELAYLLHYADERSFIILDEIGRGTSTYDGMSVAWATLEWMAQSLKARTLFATHYHELTELVTLWPKMANAHMAVDCQGKQLRFLYELKPGATHESFGIHVAQMAGLPKAVVQRAWEILAHLESHAVHQSSFRLEQLPLFAHSKQAQSKDLGRYQADVHPVFKELEGLEIQRMTPLEALNCCAKLQELYQNSQGKHEKLSGF